jgi:HK97 family phage major capsid protein
MLHKIWEIDPIMANADTRTCSKKTVSTVIENTLPTAVYEGEAEAAGYSEGTYNAVEFTCFRQQINSRVTMDQLMDAEWDMEAEMSNAAATAFALGSGANFVTGKGFKTPEGFTVNATVLTDARDSETNDTLGGDDVIRLSGDLEAGYNPKYYMNRAILAEIRTFKETNSGYLWQPGLNGPVANTLCGYPYVLCQTMASTVADGAVVMAFADMSIGYRIYNRTGTAVLRDNTTGKLTAHVEFTWYRWNTGRVVLPQAIKLLTIQ